MEPKKRSSMTLNLIQLVSPLEECQETISPTHNHSLA